MNKQQFDILELLETKTVLWDHRPKGPSVILHFSSQQKPKLIIKEKILQRASRLLDSHKSGVAYCKFLGHISANSGSVSKGVSITLKEFVESPVESKNSSLGSTTVPVVIQRKSKGDILWSQEHYLSDLKAIYGTCRDAPCIDLSHFFQIRIACYINGARSEVEAYLSSVATGFKATPVNPISILSSELSEFLARSNDEAFLTGFVSMNREKKLILLQECDPDVSSFPLVGIWVSGIHFISHPFVWAACVRYISSQLYKKRLCLPPQPFLVVIYSPVQHYPEFYDCLSTKGDCFLSFDLDKGVASTILPKVPVVDSKVLNLEAKKMKLKPIEFEEAEKQIEQTKIPLEHNLVITNTDDIPQISHHSPPCLKVVNLENQVSDVSVLSEINIENSPSDFKSYSPFLYTSDMSDITEDEIEEMFGSDFEGIDIEYPSNHLRNVNGEVPTDALRSGYIRNSHYNFNDKAFNYKLSNQSNMHRIRKQFNYFPEVAANKRKYYSRERILRDKENMYLGNSYNYFSNDAELHPDFHNFAFAQRENSIKNYAKCNKANRNDSNLKWNKKHFANLKISSKLENSHGGEEHPKSHPSMSKFPENAAFKKNGSAKPKYTCVTQRQHTADMCDDFASTSSESSSLEDSKSPPAVKSCSLSKSSLQRPSERLHSSSSPEQFCVLPSFQNHPPSNFPSVSHKKKMSTTEKLHSQLPVEKAQANYDASLEITTLNHKPCNTLASHPDYSLKGRENVNQKRNRSKIANQDQFNSNASVEHNALLAKKDEFNSGTGSSNHRSNKSSENTTSNTKCRETCNESGCANECSENTNQSQTENNASAPISNNLSACSPEKIAEIFFNYLHEHFLSKFIVQQNCNSSLNNGVAVKKQDAAVSFPENEADKEAKNIEKETSNRTKLKSKPSNNENFIDVNKSSECRNKFEKRELSNLSSKLKNYVKSNATACVATPPSASSSSSCTPDSRSKIASKSSAPAVRQSLPHLHVSSVCQTPENSAAVKHANDKACKIVDEVRLAEKPADSTPMGKNSREVVANENNSLSQLLNAAVQNQMIENVSTSTVSDEIFVAGFPDCSSISCSSSETDSSTSSCGCLSDSSSEDFGIMPGYKTTEGNEHLYSMVENHCAKILKMQEEKLRKTKKDNIPQQHLSREQNNARKKHYQPKRHESHKMISMKHSCIFTTQYKFQDGDFSMHSQQLDALAEKYEIGDESYYPCKSRMPKEAFAAAPKQLHEACNHDSNLSYYGINSNNMSIITKNYLDTFGLTKDSQVEHRTVQHNFHKRDVDFHSKQKPDNVPMLNKTGIRSSGLEINKHARCNFMQHS